MRLNDYVFAKCIIRGFDIDSANTQLLGTLKAVRADGNKLVSNSYDSKKIVIEGNIISDILEADLDQLRFSLSVINGNLDYAYAGGFRRFIVSTSNVIITRENFAVSFAPFSVSLVAFNPPFALEIDAEGGNTIETEVYNSVITSDSAEG